MDVIFLATMKTLSLVLCLLCLTSLARADELARKPFFTVKRGVAVGLLIGGAVSIAIGGVLVGLAKNANDDATRNGIYDPSAYDQRNVYQTADTALFTLGGALAITGVVLVCDR